MSPKCTAVLLEQPEQQRNRGNAQGRSETGDVRLCVVNEARTGVWSSVLGITWLNWVV